MELDDFKKIINQNQSISKELINDELLNKITSQRPSIPINKIRKKLYGEWILSVILMGGVIYLNNRMDYLLHPLAYGLLLAVIGLYLFFGIYSIVRLSSRMSFNDNSKQFLEKFIVRFKTYILWLERSVFVVVPLGFTVGYCSGIYFVKSTEFLAILLSLKSILTFIVIVTATNVIGFYVNRWTYKKLYGSNLKELEDMLYELSQPV